MEMAVQICVFTAFAEGEGPCALSCNDETVDTDGDGLSDCDECLLGMDGLSTDTDGDGMADAFEVRFGLDALQADTLVDLDGDGFSNLEEFLGGSDPTGPGSPRLSFYVSPTGNDLGTGGIEDPWRTINFALSQVTATETSPVRINCFAGEYAENVTLKPWLTLSGIAGERVTIIGFILGANDSTLIDLDVLAPFDDVILLDMNNDAMDVLGVTFTGSVARQVTGILTNGLPPGGSLIANCSFRSLRVGIDVGDAIPTIRRSLFEDISQVGVAVRETALVTDSLSLGDETDASSGFNIFRQGAGDGLAVINERNEELVMKKTTGERRARRSFRHLFRARTILSPSWA